jgi:ADP-ribose pyrophosphatase YjhB (NUDIX family)
MRKGIDYTGITIVYCCHDGDENYLFNKRSKECRDECGTWDCGGGGLDFGDTVEHTLQKEIKEEYCTDVLDYEFIGYRDVFRDAGNNKQSHWLAMDFKVLIDRDKVSNGEPHKFEEVAWYRLDNLPKPLHSQVPHTIERLLKHNQNKHR